MKIIRTMGACALSATLVACSSGAGQSRIPGNDAGNTVDSAVGVDSSVESGFADSAAPDVRDAGVADSAGETATANEASAESSALDAQVDAPAIGHDASVDDPAFGGDGSIPLPSQFDAGSARLTVESMAVRPTGEPVIGFQLQYPRYQQYVGQLLPDGSGFDPSFGQGGVVALGSSGSCYGQVLVALTPSGEVVASYGCPRGSYPQSSCVSRLTPSGQLDSTFASAGTWTNLGLSYWLVIRALAVDSRGAIWVGGEDSDSSQFSQNGDLVALDATGSFIDPMYNSGTVYFPALGNASVTGCGNVVVQSTGRVIVACNGSTQLVLTALTPAAQLDTSFGQGGSVSFPAKGSSNTVWWNVIGGLVVRSDDSLAFTQGATVTYLDLNGAPLQTVGTGGVLQITSTPSGTPLQPAGIIATWNGTDYLATTLPTGQGFAETVLLRLGPQGMNPTYGNDGVGILVPAGGGPLAAEATAKGVTIAPDNGPIVVRAEL